MTKPSSVDGAGADGGDVGNVGTGLVPPAGEIEVLGVADSHVATCTYH